RVPRLVLLQVQNHRALVAVDVEEDRAHARMAERPRLPDHVAVGRLDLDHVGAEVGEDLRRVRPHHDRGEVEDADAGERPGHCYSGWRFASFTSLRQCSISDRMNLENCEGSSGATSVPIPANFSFTSGLARPLTVASCSFCTMSFGVFAGATRPNQAMS